ncbi:unnamed protein product [Effrenium voratum]|uniref:Cyclic nucleotide-binding domain-containing protein n=1 Tax=Effrenium voratum TaxID=2562239 RepID=A0AA36MLB3_9DINO|nr:unnamed protein product [Effrenium voratum]
MLADPTRQKAASRILRKSPEERQEQELAFLAASLHDVPQFQQLDMATLKAICHAMQAQRYAKGDVILQEGSPGHEFFVLLSGSVSVHLFRPEDTPPKSRFLDYTIVAQAAEPSTAPGTSAKPRRPSRAKQALNARLAHTVDWDVAANEAEVKKGMQRMSTTMKVIHQALAFSDSEDSDESPRLRLRSEPRTERSEREMCPRKPQPPSLRAAVLFPGSSFGELALDTFLPRQCTVKCEERCWVAKLRQQDYHHILTSHETGRRQRWLAFAEAAPLLRDLEEPARVHLEPHCKLLQVSKGQEVCQPGELEVVFLAEGCFEVSLPGTKNRQVPTSLVLAPAVFGLSPALRDEPRQQETLTCISASGLIYKVQAKHVLVMLSPSQQQLLTKAAFQEKRFHLARAAVMRAMVGEGRLYCAGPRLAAVRQQLRQVEEETPEALNVPNALSACWSAETLDRARRESKTYRPCTENWKMPALETDGMGVKRRLSWAAKAGAWSPEQLALKGKLRRSQQRGAFHGFGPVVQANGFLTQFFKKASEPPWSHALRNSASAPSLRLAGAEIDVEAETERRFEPLLDEQIEEAEEEQFHKDRAASKIQASAKRFLSRRSERQPKSPKSPKTPKEQDNVSEAGRDAGEKTRKSPASDGPASPQPKPHASLRQALAQSPRKPVPVPDMPPKEPPAALELRALPPISVPLWRNEILEAGSIVRRWQEEMDLTGFKAPQMTRLPLLPSPRGSVVLPARLAVRSDSPGVALSRPTHEDEVDLKEIYRHKVPVQRARVKLKLAMCQRPIRA